MGDADWFNDAECKGTDPDMFFPTQGETPEPEALAACDRCPVTTQCLQWALAHKEPGIWGGTTDRQRRTMRQYGLTEPPARRGAGTGTYKGPGVTRTELLSYLERNPRTWHRVSDLALWLRLSPNTVQRALSRLREDGIVDHEFGGYYRMAQVPAEVT